MTTGRVTATITAENTWTDSMAIWGKFNVTISGISGDTVQVVRSKDDGVLWKLVKSYTADKEESGEEIERGWIYRIGVPTGSYSAGNILVGLSF